MVEPLATAHPLYPLPVYQDSAEAGRLILRDGTIATVRVATTEDQPALREFFQQLSPESRRHRFFSPAKPTDETIRDLADASQPRSQLTLLVLRATDTASRIIAVGSYFSKDRATAEVALAVNDAFHGKGLGSLLVERLAVLALRAGFSRFWAVTHTDNQLMIEVFRRSGFTSRERLGGDAVEFEMELSATAASAARSEWLDQMFTAASLHPFFHPRSVAVVGVSRDPGSIGRRIFEALVATPFQGAVYPVTRGAAAIGSHQAYASVRQIPAPVDLVVVSVPAPAVLSVVDDCAARGVRALVVITAGFAEAGAEGKALQRQLVERTRGYGMRMIGPNCMGLINTEPSVQLNASFSPAYPPPGRVAMSSQSGALGIAILALARQQSLGLSHFVSVGNKADVSGNDLLQYWEQDPSTDVILLYLESFGNPRRFARIARRVSRTKPIVAIKGGRTSAGRRAASSHTAALAASNIAVEALFHQAGVIPAQTLEELFDLAALLSAQPLPKGRRVGIVTNAGGPGILCADTCETGGLQISPLAASTAATLASFLPASASISNPVDMIASATPEQYERAVATVLATEEVDALIVIYISVGVTDPKQIGEGIARGIRAGRRTGGAGKPIAACLMGSDGAPAPLHLEQETVPTYIFPESAANAMSKIAAYAEWRAQPQGTLLVFDDAEPERAREICQRAVTQRGEGWLTVEEIQAIANAMGLPLAPGGLARSADEAVAVARRVGWPVALKLASREIVHKTEYGAVHLNLRDEAAVREAFASIQHRLTDAGKPGAMDGVLVQPMLSGGVEVMVGMVEDPSFGPLIAFGLGGVHVEILRDVSFRITPLTTQDVQEMVREIRGFRLLEGYRGHPAADVAALEALLLRLSLLVEEVPEIAELDLNPIFALPPGQGCRIVDARIRVTPLKRPATTTAPSPLATSPKRSLSPAGAPQTLLPGQAVAGHGA